MTEFTVKRVRISKFVFQYYMFVAITVVPATDGTLGEWPPALAGHFCNVLVNYFAMLMSLYPAATCLTRSAASQMIDPVPAKADSDHE